MGPHSAEPRLSLTIAPPYIGFRAVQEVLTGASCPMNHACINDPSYLSTHTPTHLAYLTQGIRRETERNISGLYNSAWGNRPWILPPPPTHQN